MGKERAITSLAVVAGLVVGGIVETAKHRSDSSSVPVRTSTFGALQHAPVGTRAWIQGYPVADQGSQSAIIVPDKPFDFLGVHSESQGWEGAVTVYANSSRTAKTPQVLMLVPITVTSRTFMGRQLPFMGVQTAGCDLGLDYSDTYPETKTGRAFKLQVVVEADSYRPGGKVLQCNNAIPL